MAGADLKLHLSARFVIATAGQEMTPQELTIVTGLCRSLDEDKLMLHHHCQCGALAGRRQGSPNRGQSRSSPAC